MMAYETGIDKNDEQAILKLARERYSRVDDAEFHIREASIEDIKFVYNVEDGQWPEEVRQERLQDNRPCLTSNKLRKYVAQVANQERENRLAGKVRGVDDKADPEKAQIYEDLIRQIEYNSGADEVYSCAGEQAVAGGFGYFRILTEIPDDGFDQEIVIRKIDNQFSVHMDPKRRFCFISDVMSIEEFEQEYPDAEKEDFEQVSTGERWEHWYENDNVRVAEYFVKKPKTRKLVKALDAQGNISVYEITDEVTEKSLTDQNIQILDRRDAKSHEVCWYKITGNQILEHIEDLPSREIPVIEVKGDEINIEGKIYKRSLVRDGKDPQRLYNYWLTTEAETVALQPKAPYILSEDQITGHENEWNDANRKNLPYLTYRGDARNRPQREVPPQLSAGHVNMINIANNDLKDTIGMYEANVGQQSNERSGRAIFARQQAGQISTLHFRDNLRRAVVDAGKIMIEMIPKVYDSERIIRLRGEDGTERTERINQTVLNEDGTTVTINDLTVGKYDLQADVRLYATRRQESMEAILQSMQYAPQIAPFIVDLLFKFMDSPVAEDIQQRVEAFMQSAQQQQEGQGAGRAGAGGPGGPIPSLSPTASEANGGF